VRDSLSSTTAKAASRSTIRRSASTTGLIDGVCSGRATSTSRDATAHAATFGFWLAWQESDPGEAIVALDDDCRVADPDFAARVEAALSPAPRPIATCSSEHLNILDLYRGNGGDEPRLFPRGFPYSARLGADGAHFHGESASAPAFSLGLWRGVFDINAVDKVRSPRWTYPEAELRVPSVVVPPGRLVSVCSMNMHFRRELIPAVFQLPMHIEVIRNGVIDRYATFGAALCSRR